jgi:hypothetical protein
MPWTLTLLDERAALVPSLIGAHGRGDKRPRRRPPPVADESALQEPPHALSSQSQKTVTVPVTSAASPVAVTSDTRMGVAATSTFAQACPRKLDPPRKTG